MATSWSWSYETLAPLERGEGEGERWKLYDLDSNMSWATVVRFPGRMFRIYWSGGQMTDHPSTAEAHKALRVGLNDEALPPFPNRSDAAHKPLV